MWVKFTHCRSYVVSIQELVVYHHRCAAEVCKIKNCGILLFSLSIETFFLKDEQLIHKIEIFLQDANKNIVLNICVAYMWFSRDFLIRNMYTFLQNHGEDKDDDARRDTKRSTSLSYHTAFE